MITIESLSQQDCNATLANLDTEVDGIHARVQLHDNRNKERELMRAMVPPILVEMMDVNKEALPPL